MNWLSKEELDSWFNLLPMDVASSMEKPRDEEQEAVDKIADKIKSITDGNSAVKVVKENPEVFIDMGRPRRIRFLAWISAKDYPDRDKVFTELFSGEADESGSGGNDKAGPYFKEDVRALVEALGPRAARLIVDAETVDMVKTASFEATNELEVRSGGSI